MKLYEKNLILKKNQYVKSSKFELQIILMNPNAKDYLYKYDQLSIP